MSQIEETGGGAEWNGSYITIEELRSEAEATEVTMPDAMASRLLRLATAIIEKALGQRPIHEDGPQQGLKIAESDVLPWQWVRLRETVAVLGAHLFVNPDLVRGIYFDSVSGPDFSRSGGQGKIFGNEAALMFASTGLMPNAARARP
jgi:hypothetical protein